MTHSVLPTFRKFWPDALAGAATFALILGLVGGDTSVAASTQTAAMAGSWPSAVVMTAATVSLLVAVNSAFVRHLVRTYSAPRRPSARPSDPATGNQP